MTNSLTIQQAEFYAQEALRGNQKLPSGLVAENMFIFALLKSEMYCDADTDQRIIYDRFFDSNGLSDALITQYIDAARERFVKNGAVL